MPRSRRLCWRAARPFTAGPADEPYRERRRVTVLSLRLQRSAATALEIMRQVEDRLRATGAAGLDRGVRRPPLSRGRCAAGGAAGLRAVCEDWDQAPGLRPGTGVFSGLVLSGADRGPQPEDAGLVAGCAAELAAAAGEVRISAAAGGLAGDAAGHLLASVLRFADGVPRLLGELTRSLQQRAAGESPGALAAARQQAERQGSAYLGLRAALL